MTKNQHFELQVIQTIGRIHSTLRDCGINNIESIADCLLYLLFSAHKQIPIQFENTPLLKESDIHIYTSLRQLILAHFTTAGLDSSKAILYLQQIHETIIEDKNFYDDAKYPQAISILFQYLYLNGERIGMKMSLPNEVSELLSGILNELNIKSVYNPFAGTAPIVPSLNRNIYYNGQDLNSRNVLYAQILIDAYQRTNATIELGDSYHQWNTNQCDAIVADVPWGGLRTDLQESSEAFFLRKASESANISVGIYPIGLLFRHKEYALRKSLIDNELIESIIFLPKNIFAGVMISTCIIITNKHKQRVGEVQLVDATKLVHNNTTGELGTLYSQTILSLIKHQDNTDCVHWIKTLSIQENNYDLFRERYIGDEAKPIEVPEGYALLPIKDFCSIIRNRAKQNGEGHVVRMRDLADTPITITRTIDDFPIETYKKGWTIVNKNALLLGTVSRLKPTYYFSGGQNIYLTSTVIALDVNESIVSIPYLVGELNKEYVRTQIYVAGTSIIPHIHYDQILELRILVPDLIKQESEVNAKINNIEKEKEVSLAKQLEDFKKEMHNRKHDIMTHVQNIKKGLDLFELYQKLLPDHELSDKMSKTIYDMRTSYNKMYKQLEHFADNDTFGQPIELDIISHLKKEEGKFDNYKVRLEVNEDHIPASEKALVVIAEIDFERITANILGNAKKHGFTDLSRDDYNIIIKLDANMKTGMYVIDFYNNGNPFPAYMDKSKFGIDGEAAGPTAGTGKGGYRIKRICQHYHGDYSIGQIVEDHQIWNYIRIILPIHYKDE